MNFYFAEPDFAFLFLGFLPFAYLTLKASRSAQTVFVLILRCLGFSCLIFCLMQPFREKKSPAALPHFLIGIDASASIAKDHLDALLTELQPVLKPHTHSYFALQSGVPASETLTGVQSFFQKRPMESRILLSLEDAEALVRENHYPVLLALTDGQDTFVKNSSLQTLADRGVFLHFLPVNPAKTLKALSLQTTRNLPVKQTALIKFFIHSSLNQEVQILWLKDGQEIKKESRQLNFGLNRLEHEFSENEPGSKKIQVRVIGQNESLKASARVYFYKLNRIALVDGESQANWLFDHLKALNLPVERITAQNLNQPKSMDHFSVILLHDLPSKNLPEGFAEKIRQFVLAGGGLGLFGGMNGFGLGGYHKSKFEEISPVVMPERTYRKSVAVIFLLDASGSMLAEDSNVWSDANKLLEFLSTASDTQKPIMMAKKAAREVLSELNGLELAVLRFSDKVSVAVPLIKVSEETRPLILSGINQIEAGGGTMFAAPLQVAMSMVAENSFREVRFLLFSDGTPSDKAILPAVLEQISQRKIILDTVGFGKGANMDLLRAMAQKTGGQSVQSETIQDLKPSIEKALDKVFGPPYVAKSTPVNIAPEAKNWLSSIQKLPPVEGYNTTGLKPLASSILSLENNDPLLALWSHGLGQVFIFASDPQSTWTASLKKDPGLAQILGATVQRVGKKNFDPIDYSASLQGNRLSLKIQALNEEGDYIDRLNFKTRLTGPRESIHLEWAASGQGEFRYETILSQQGEYVLSGTVSLEKGQSFALNDEFMITTDAETSFEQMNFELAEYMQKQGLRLENAKDWQKVLQSFKPKEEIYKTAQHLWILALGLFFLLADLVARRLKLLDQFFQMQTDSEKHKAVVEDYLQRARQALKQADKENAQKLYLAAIRHARESSQENEATRIWQEFRSRVN